MYVFRQCTPSYCDVILYEYIWYGVKFVKLVRFIIHFMLIGLIDIDQQKTYVTFH